METISARIRRITDDLHALQEDLRALARRQPTAAQQEQLLEELLNFELVHDLKATVDDMRHFLWSYIETATRDSGGDLDQTLISVRMQRTTDMLRVLAQDAGAPGNGAAPASRTFFEQVQEIAAAAVQRHGVLAGPNEKA